MKTIELKAESIEITPSNHKTVNVVIKDINTSEVLNQFSAEEIVNNYEDEYALLKAIGIEKAMEYWDIEIEEE